MLHSRGPKHELLLLVLSIFRPDQLQQNSKSVTFASSIVFHQLHTNRTLTAESLWLEETQVRTGAIFTVVHSWNHQKYNTTALPLSALHRISRLALLFAFQLKSDLEKIISLYNSQKTFLWHYIDLSKHATSKPINSWGYFLEFYEFQNFRRTRDIYR